MTIYTRPDEVIFASGAKQGEIVTFPDLVRGWGVTIDTTNGIPPMEFFNFTGNRLDKAINYLLQTGVPEHSGTTEYPKGAIVQSAGQLYIALQQNTAKEPQSDPSNWANLTPPASTSKAGIVALSNDTSSTHEDIAATSLAVKRSYDLAEIANSGLRGKVSKSGDTMTGDLQLETTGGYISVMLKNSTSNNLILETVPDTTQTAGHIILRAASGDNLSVLSIPREDGNLLSTGSNFYKALVGTPLPYPRTDVPAGFLAMNGQRFSTSRYPELARLYPSGQLPDLRGLFIRGIGGNAGSILSRQKDALQDHFHYIPTQDGSNDTLEPAISSVIIDNTEMIENRGAFLSKNKLSFKGDNFYLDTSGSRVRTYSVSVGNSGLATYENRPINMAFQWICLAE